MSESKKIVSLVVNIAVVVMEVVAAFLSWNRQGSIMFIYFTELSNIFAGFACLVTAVYIIREMAKGYTIPSWVWKLRYVAAGALALTFFTVIFILAPIAGADPDYGFAKSYMTYLFFDSMIVTHTLGPLTVMYSFLFLDDYASEKIKESVIAIIPTVLYALVSVTMNLLRIWVGPYPFLKVYQNGAVASVIWVIVMFSFSYLLCFGLWRIKKVIKDKNKDTKKE